MSESDECNCWFCQNPDARAPRIEQEARQAVEGSRRNDYGTPQENHNRTASLYSGYLKAKYGVELELDAYDVCWMNVLQKISRSMNTVTRDTLVDVIGYTINVEMLEEK